MHKKQLPPITYFQFTNLTPYANLQHAVISRHKGVSPAPFDSLNIGDNTQDSPKNVQANLDLIKKEFHIKTIIMAEQVHEDTIAFVDHTAPSIIPQCDALITQTKHIALMIKHADCQAAILYDPQHHAVAVVHAGWKGNVKKIYQKTIEAMHEKLNTNPKHLIVSISPSLGPDHAEFINYQQEFPPSLHHYRTHNHFDLWSLAHDELTSSGVNPHNIEIAQICTYCDKNNFFSYRRDRNTGRNATFALLN